MISVIFSCSIFVYIFSQEIVIVANICFIYFQAEDAGRGRGVCGRGPGRAAGAVRPDRRSVRRPGLRRGGRPHHRQAPDRRTDDAGEQRRQSG